MMRNFLIAIIIFLFTTVSQASDLSEKYDLNTEIQMEGEITDILDKDSGPEIFKFTSNNRVYQVHAGPRWYFEESGIELKKGDKVKVTGSKTYDKDGNLVLIIYDLKYQGTEKVYQFRDNNMRPLWQGRGSAGGGIRGVGGGNRGAGGHGGGVRGGGRGR